MARHGLLASVLDHGFLQSHNGSARNTCVLCELALGYWFDVMAHVRYSHRQVISRPVAEIVSTPAVPASVDSMPPFSSTWPVSSGQW